MSISDCMASYFTLSSNRSIRPRRCRLGNAISSKKKKVGKPSHIGLYTTEMEYKVLSFCNKQAMAVIHVAEAVCVCVQACVMCGIQFVVCDASWCTTDCIKQWNSQCGCGIVSPSL